MLEGGKDKHLLNKIEYENKLKIEDENNLKAVKTAWKNIYFGIYHSEYRRKPKVINSCANNHKEYRKQS